MHHSHPAYIHRTDLDLLAVIFETCTYRLLRLLPQMKNESVEINYMSQIFKKTKNEEMWTPFWDKIVGYHAELWEKKQKQIINSVYVVHLV